MPVLSLYTLPIQGFMTNLWQEINLQAIPMDDEATFKGPMIRLDLSRSKRTSYIN